jgi:hypothetical protein
MRKFVTTPQYAPRLRERLCLEQQLADDAQARGWECEVDRHQRVTERIRSLLSDLGDPSAPPEGPH